MEICQAEFADLIDELWQYVEAIERQGDMGVVSVFEMLTAMAFFHFRRVGADFAVIETGLGGRLDATNVVDPEVSVITPISLDHVRILGDTISLIAGEKAGIIKTGKPTVVARNHPAAWRVIKERARQVGSEVIGACATVPFKTSNDKSNGGFKQEFVLKRWRSTTTNSTGQILVRPPDPGLTDVKISTSLLGSHQIDNARTAAATFNVLYRQGHEFDVNSTIRGIGDVKWPCRTEYLEIAGWPPIILDGAHNDASLKALMQTVVRHVSGQVTSESDADRVAPYILIMGATSGHEYDDMARVLASKARWAIATQSRHPKSSPASRLAASGKTYGVNFSVCQTVRDALIEAKRRSDADSDVELIIATGSLFVAAEAREHLLGIEPEIYEDLQHPYMATYESTD